MHSTQRAQVLLAAAIGLAACTDESTGPGSGLSVSRSSIEFTPAAPSAAVTLGGPSGAAWSLLVAPTWLRVSPPGGVFGTATTLNLEAPDLTGLPPGAYSGDVVIGTDESSVSVRVNARVAAHPRPVWSASPLEIGETTDTASVTLTNQGNVALVWQLVPGATWLSSSPSSGRLERGARTLVRVRADKRTLPAGVTVAELRLTAAGVELPLPVRAAVGAGPIAGFSVPRLVVPRGAVSAGFSLANAGRTPLTWSVEAVPPWLSVHPTSGSLAAGANAAISATVDRARIPAGQHRDSVVFSTNGGLAVLPVVVTSAGAVVGEIWRLDVRVADASYDRHSNRLVVLSADGAELLVLDMTAGIVDRVALPSAGQSLTLSPDGRRVGVTRDAYVSVIDLASRTILASAPAGRARYASLSDGGWVYVYPRYGMWDQLRSINVLTGEQTKDPWLIYGSSGKIHPSGAYLYTQNGWSLEKWDVRGGGARFLYESPIYGPYGSTGSLWLSEDGARIFTASRQVFHTAPEREWQHAGQLPLPREVGSIAHSAAANRLYVVTTPYTEWWQEPYRGDDQQVTVIDATTLAALAPLPLPTFDVPDGAGGLTRYATRGRYVFVDAVGSRLYVLVQIDPAAGLTSDWGVATLQLEPSP